MKPLQEGSVSAAENDDKKTVDKQSSESEKKGFFCNFSELFSEELLRGYDLDADESNKTKFTERRERVYAFLLLPIEMEPFMTFGTLQCLDTFLYMFTFLPLRCALVCLRFATHPVRTLRKLSPAYTIDLLKLLIVMSAFYIVSSVDTSALYHNIRMQAVIKLYLFFNMLDVCDRLLSSVGQDILDALFWTATERVSRARYLLTVQHLGLAIGYVAAHTFIVLLQAVTLNVAFNSQNKGLITIMLSNNFVEIKGSVFKRFTKNNLFQMACADVRERFHYVVLAVVVVLRNLSAYSWTVERELLEPLLVDAVLVMLFEVVVDWIKHAFIAKFNELPRECYRDYLTSLAYDMKNSRDRCASDQSDLVSRRMGFIPLPLACLILLVTRNLPLLQATEFDIDCFSYVTSCFTPLFTLASVFLPVEVADAISEAASTSVYVLIPAAKCSFAFAVALVARTFVAMLTRHIAYRTVDSYEHEYAKREAARNERERTKAASGEGGENETFMVQRAGSFIIQRGGAAQHRRAHSDSFSVDQLTAIRRRETQVGGEPPIDHGSAELFRRNEVQQMDVETTAAAAAAAGGIVNVAPPPEEPSEAHDRPRRASAYARLARSPEAVQDTNDQLSKSPEALSADNSLTLNQAGVGNRQSISSRRERDRDRISLSNMNEYAQITMSRPVSSTTLNLDMYCEQSDLPEPQMLMNASSQHVQPDFSKSDSEEHEDYQVMRVRKRLFSTINEQQQGTEDDNRLREVENEDAPSLASTPARRGRHNSAANRERAVPTENELQSETDTTVRDELPNEIERFSMTRAGIV